MHSNGAFAANTINIATLVSGGFTEELNSKNTLCLQAEAQFSFFMFHRAPRGQRLTVPHDARHITA